MRTSPRLLKGPKPEKPVISPKDQAIRVLQRNLGREPGDSERAEWIEECFRLADTFKAARNQAKDSTGPATSDVELIEIRNAAETLGKRLDALSRESFFRLRDSWRQGKTSGFLTQEESKLSEVARELRGPMEPGGALAEQMRMLERLASCALKRPCPAGQRGQKVYEVQVGPPDLGFIGECCRTLAHLSGSVGGLRAFARAVHALAFPDGPPLQDDWGKNHFNTVKAWWVKYGPHEAEILAAELQESIDENEDYWAKVERITGLPHETVSLAWGPHMLPRIRPRIKSGDTQKKSREMPKV